MPKRTAFIWICLKQIVQATHFADKICYWKIIFLETYRKRKQKFIPSNRIHLHKIFKITCKKLYFYEINKFLFLAKTQTLAHNETALERFESYRKIKYVVHSLSYSLCSHRFSRNSCLFASLICITYDYCLSFFYAPRAPFNFYEQ